MRSDLFANCWLFEQQSAKVQRSCVQESLTTMKRTFLTVETGFCFLGLFLVRLSRWCKYAFIFYNHIVVWQSWVETPTQLNCVANTHTCVYFTGRDGYVINFSFYRTLPLFHIKFSVGRYWMLDVMHDGWWDDLSCMMHDYLESDSLYSNLIPQV